MRCSHADRNATYAHAFLSSGSFRAVARNSLRCASSPASGISSIILMIVERTRCSASSLGYRILRGEPFSMPHFVDWLAPDNTVNPAAGLCRWVKPARHPPAPAQHSPGRRFGSREHFWPLGPVGNVVALHSTLKIIQFGQSAVAGVDAEFDVPRFEFACLVYGLLAGQVIDRKHVRLFAKFYGITHCPCSMLSAKHTGVLGRQATIVLKIQTDPLPNL
jgi:hypothetical protein